MSSTPESVDAGRFLARLPEHVRREAAAQGPLPAEAVESDEDRVARLRAQAEAKAAKWNARLPQMFADASLDDLADEQGRSAIRVWLTASGLLHLILAGAIGTGKTHAAYAVGNAALAQGQYVLAATVGDLLDAMRPGTNDSRDLEHDARECDLLVLDDLGAGNQASAWAQERLTMLLDARMRHERRTVVTTNLTSAQIAESWGPRFLDRLLYRSEAVVFTGPSRRSAW